MQNNTLVQAKYYPFESGSSGNPGVCQMANVKNATAPFAKTITTGVPYVLVGPYPSPATNDQMKSALMLNPITVEVNANPWPIYKGGVFSETCPASNINHGVILVGWGEWSNGSYWLAMNSWGT